MPPMSPVAVVTGSNRGIGEAVARSLQIDVAHTVVTNGRSARKGPGDLHVRADVSTPAGAKKLVAAAKRAYGRLDVLVCNVGEYVETPLSKMDLGAWERILRSNLFSAWYCVREALPLLRKRGGCVITIGTPMAHVARANPRVVAFQMAKTALAVFTKSLAQAEARNGIRANMVSPGYIRTYAYTKAEIAQVTPKIPAGRIGRPEDVARAVLWLASDAASYVNGAVIDVGGGVWV
jgi:NAD(P)-dependent dehydrogenase (short-subunit alcohol dehydrogenase family)